MKEAILMILRMFFLGVEGFAAEWAKLHLFIDSFIHAFIRSLVRSFVHSFFGVLNMA